MIGRANREFGSAEALVPFGCTMSYINIQSTSCHFELISKVFSTVSSVTT